MKFENILPIIAPAPPAVVIGIRLYEEIIHASSLDWWPVASLAAFLGMVGIIGAEMYSYKQAAIAFAEGERNPAILAFLGGLLCSGLVIYAIYTSENSKPLVTAVIVAIVGYVVKAITDYIATMRAKRAKEYAQSCQTKSMDNDADIRKREIDLQIAREERLRALADARSAKTASGGQSANVRRTATGQRTALDPVKLRDTVAYLKQRPDPVAVSVRDLESANLGYKKTQAAEYKQAALDAMRAGEK
jgi:hypothetical protein